MNNLWIYGDSFSMDYNLDYAPFAKKYIEFKNRTVKTYGNFISENLNLNLINKAIGGTDNYTIFESFCNDVDSIQENDLVILNWGPQTRFRIVREDINQWTPIGNLKDEFLPYIDNNSVRLLLTNRLHDLYGEEIKNWSKLIKKSLQNNFVYIWTWYDMNFTYEYQNVKEETNGMIDDGHWSENGHEKFAKEILEIYRKWKTI